MKLQGLRKGSEKAKEAARKAVETRRRNQIEKIKVENIKPPKNKKEYKHTLIFPDGSTHTFFGQYLILRRDANTTEICKI